MILFDKLASYVFCRIPFVCFALEQQNKDAVITALEDVDVGESASLLHHTSTPSYYTVCHLQQIVITVPGIQGSKLDFWPANSPPLYVRAVTETHRNIGHCESVSYLLFTRLSLLS